MFPTSQPPRAGMARLLTGLLLGGLLAGCLPGNLPTAVGKGSTVKKPSPAPSVAPSDVPSSGPSTGPVIGNPGGGLISNNGGSLSGVVRAPAGLIGNNGGSYRVFTAAPESPLADALVRLVDAQGTPLKDAQGRELTTRTDAQGMYGFTAALPAQQILVEVVLPENKGTLRAIAPYASGVKKADLGLISTLTTTYMLEKYLKGQSDPVARLERLPASMEVETRLKTQTAFEGGTAAVPALLTPEAIVATVDQLRQQSTTLNAQFEEVKRVLVVAGQSDLGSGRAGTEVDIPNIGGLVPGPGGTLFISAPFDRRVWKLRADGVLETAVGKGGTAVSATIEGMPGKDAGLGAIRHMALDAQGRVLVVDDAFSPSRGNAFRLDTNGRLQVLWKGPDAARFAFPAGGEAVYVFTTTDVMEDPMSAKLWKVTPGQAPQEIRSYPDKEAIYLNNADSAGVDAAGNPWFTTMWATDTEAATLRVKVDATTGAMQVVDQVGEDKGTYEVDGRAQAFLHAPEAETLVVKLPDGTSRTLPIPTEARSAYEAAALEPDQTFFMAGSGRVFRIAPDGKVTRLVGADGSTSGGSANSLAVTATGIAVDSAGVVYASELKNRQILKVQNGQLTPFYSAPQGESPRTLRFDAQGRLHASLQSEEGPQRLVRFDASGQPTTVYTWPESFTFGVGDFVIGADGAVYVSVSEDKYLDPPQTDEDGNTIDRITDTWVRRLPVNGFSALEIDHQEGQVMRGAALAIGPGGVLYLGDDLAATQRVRTWTTAAGLKPLAENTDSELMMDLSGIAVDAKNRVYLTSTFANRLLRYDPVTKAFSILAGDKGQYLSGSGIDNSIEYPAVPVLGPDGTLFLSDERHSQIKRLPADWLK